MNSLCILSPWLLWVVMGPSVQASCPLCASDRVADKIIVHTSLYRDTASGKPPIATTESIAFADVDGDGFADLCAHDGTSVVCNLHENADGSSSCGLIGTKQQRAPRFDSSWISQDYYWQTIQYPDVDGDNVTDVCGRGSGGIQCATAKNGFNDGAMWISGAFSNSASWQSQPYYWKTIRFPDVNGDQKSDVCGRAPDGIYCALSTGTSFTSFRRWTTDFSDQQGWHTSEAYWGTIQFADVDGDGRDDVCGRDYGGMHCSLASTYFHGFHPVTRWDDNFSDGNGWNAPHYYRTIQLGDINGDGRADICGRGSAGVHCGISERYNRTIGISETNGDGRSIDPCGQGCGRSERFGQVSNLDVTAFSNANGWTAIKYYDTLRLVDVNGDGRVDVCGRGWEGVYCAIANEPGVQSGSIWRNLFAPATLWIRNFGDIFGWGDHEAFWGTVQPATVFGTGVGAVFCGRGKGGILCHNPKVWPQCYTTPAPVAPTTPAPVTPAPVVPPRFTFTVDLSFPSGNIVESGNSLTGQIQVRRTGGPGGTVALSTSSLPSLAGSDITASLSQTSVAVNSNPVTVSVTIRTSVRRSRLGTSTLSVQGTSGTESATDSANFVVAGVNGGFTNEGVSFVFSGSSTCNPASGAAAVTAMVNTGAGVNFITPSGTPAAQVGQHQAYQFDRNCSIGFVLGRTVGFVNWISIGFPTTLTGGSTQIQQPNAGSPYTTNFRAVSEIWTSPDETVFALVSPTAGSNSVLVCNTVAGVCQGMGGLGIFVDSITRQDTLVVVRARSSSGNTQDTPIPIPGMPP